ncbi:MAG: hypothetical protein JWN34_1758 [Bryobacterales bacterium]|nr:hypothetical protein [Bryobacterales bacterium]
MDSLQRARTFIAAGAGKLALAIIPLAAAAITAMPAQAGFVQPAQFAGTCEVSSSNGFAVNVNGSGGFCSADSTSTPGANSGANSFSVYGTNRAYSFGASGSSFGLTYTAALFDSNIAGDASSIASGPQATVATGSVPLAWDFTLTGSDPQAEIRYSLSFTTGGITYSPFGEYGVAVSGQRVSGSGLFTGFDGFGPSVFVTFSASTDTGASGGQYLDVDVPGGQTLDFNVATAEAPEPASLFLIVPALGMLFIRRKKQ